MSDTKYGRSKFNLPSSQLHLAGKSKELFQNMNTFFDKDSKIWHGVHKDFCYSSNDSIGAVVLKTMLQNPDHINQICYQSGKEYTNRQLAELSIQVAQQLKKMEFHQGDIIGLCAANSDYVAPLFFGVMLSGLCVCTLDPSYDKDGIRTIYSTTKPKMMFCDGDIYHRVREAFDDCGLSSSKIVTIRNHIKGVPNILEFFEAPIKFEDFRAPSLEKGYHQTAALVCTSGTTGFPKIVSVSHAALMSHVEIQQSFPVKWLCFSSLHWFSGIASLVRGTLEGFTRIISDKPFNAYDFFDIVKRYQVNVFWGPPTQIALSMASDKLADSDLSSIKVCFICGSSVSFSMIEKFKKYVSQAELMVGYGMSELFCMISGGVCDTSNTVGKLHSNMEVKIVDESGNLLGPNETGELCARSKFPWAGYFNNPEATKAIYDDNGWIHSGDIGYFNDEGQLFLVDRKSSIRKYNNFHFSPTEIETVIKQIDEVIDACVVGIPDSIYGFLPAAAVIKRPDTESEMAPKIYQHIADRMPHFNRLRGGIYFFSSLPLTATGKYIRQEVLEMCEAKRLLANVDGLPTEIEN